MKNQGLRFEIERIILYNFEFQRKGSIFKDQSLNFKHFSLNIKSFFEIQWLKFNKGKSGRGYICSWRVPYLKIFIRKVLWIKKTKYISVMFIVDYSDCNFDKIWKLNLFSIYFRTWSFSLILCNNMCRLSCGLCAIMRCGDAVKVYLLKL